MNRAKIIKICQLVGWQVSVDGYNYIIQKGSKNYYHPTLKRALEDIIEEEGRKILQDKDYHDLKEALDRIDSRSLHISKILDETLKKYPIGGLK